MEAFGPLRVYKPRDSETSDADWWWSPQHQGLVKVPGGWGFLPAGDAFLTRAVKAAGPHWEVVRKARGYTRVLGILAPADAIERARNLADQTAADRAQKRERDAAARAKAEERYRSRFEDAVKRFLAFPPEHEGLTSNIARRATERATEVGSGRVGRASRLGLEEKAALAARAAIRHEFTPYDQELPGGLVWLDVSDEEYRAVKARAEASVDAFLADHRQPGQLDRPNIRSATASA